jgi:hypothetical protein
MSWIGRVFGSDADNREEGVPREDRELISIDLARLDELRPDLGRQLIQYVCVGDNDSVLLTAKQLSKEIRQKLHSGGWSSGGRWTTGRSDYLLAPKKWDAAVVRRYGEVLAPIYDGGWPKLLGTERSPSWFRAVMRAYGESRGAILEAKQWKQEPSPRAKEPWTIEWLKALLGEDELAILDLAFERDDGWNYRYNEKDSPENLTGFELHLRTDPERRVAELRRLSAKARAYGMRVLARLGLTDGQYFEFAFEQTGDSAKGAREAAVVLLRAAPTELTVQKILERFVDLKSAQKIELARILSLAAGTGAPARLQPLLEAEKNESVRAELARLLSTQALDPKADERRADGREGYSALSGAWVAAPPSLPLPEDKPVTPALRKLIAEAFAAWRDEDERYNREQKDNKFFHKRTPLHASVADDFCRCIETSEFTATRGLNLFNVMGNLAKHVSPVLAHPDLTLWHLLRGGHRQHGRPHLDSAFWATPVARSIRARLAKVDGLRTLADVSAALGDSEDGCMRFLIKESYFSHDLSDWQPDQLWPYFARHFALLDEALGLAPPSSKEELSETRALDLLALFPQTPARYLAALLDRALGDRKLVRQPARDLLAAAPGLDEILVPLLKHPKAEMRAGTADWLADRQATAALGPLLESARKEKLLGAKAAMLSAISRLGGEITEFVSAETQLADAKAGLKKAGANLPSWLPAAALPAVRRRDGTALDPDIIRWWIISGLKLKEAGGNPWFDLLLDQLDPEDAGKLGLTILQAWVAYDTAVPSDDEANAYAAQSVDSTLAMYKRWKPETTREWVFAMLRQQKLSSYLNSGNDEKGMLALASRAPGANAVSLVKAFFRDHYTRTAQCKALLSCLASNPSPLAIQYVLTIAKRWRTRTVQELAVELVSSIAEKRGWTTDQLADRTVPTGGFDDAGILPLPIGEKTYSARLDGDGKISLFNPDGKTVQGLPASVSDDAAPALKDAKALLSTARKEVKQVFDLQAHRLYEALCVQREWPAAEWDEHLLNHPLMRRLAQRLIWIGSGENGKQVATFRPLEDLTLTDATDNPVQLEGMALIRLAHASSFSAEKIAAWKTHLKDYEVAPLFDQLNRPRMTLDAGLGDATEITDRKGWMIEAFKLRGAATKLGYTRGTAEDGGWFFTYEKRFESLQLVTIVEFTGNGLPEENRISALQALRFAKLRKGSLRWNEGVPLKSVPQVLLGEAWSDIHAMAAAGTGFDAGWEKKVEW